MIGKFSISPGNSLKLSFRVIARSVSGCEAEPKQTRSRCWTKPKQQAEHGPNEIPRFARNRLRNLTATKKPALLALARQRIENADAKQTRSGPGARRDLNMLLLLVVLMLAFPSRHPNRPGLGQGLLRFARNDENPNFLRSYDD